MGNRLSVIVTRTGDQGTTSLDGQLRISKYHERITVVGELDEFNAVLGCAIAVVKSTTVVEHPKWHAALIAEMVRIQHDLFSLGGSVVMASNLLTSNRVDELESQIEAWLAVLPPLKEFILPGGSAASAHLHLARTVCRRVERCWWHAYAQEIESRAVEEAAPHFAMAIGQYLNRLADWLFVAARLHNQMEAHAETLWKNPTSSRD